MSLKQKFVIRLMTQDGQMLGHAVEHLVGKEGSFRAEVSEILITATGIAHHISVHWCDLDVVRTEPLMTGPQEVPEALIGTKAKFYWTFKSVWLVRGEEKGHLPPIVVDQNVVLSPPAGALGAVAAAAAGGRLETK